jgi:hypothetical protein
VLPTPSVVAERAKNLGLLFDGGDPLEVREALRRYFLDGRITLTPAPEGHYVAESHRDVRARRQAAVGRGCRHPPNGARCASVVSKSLHAMSGGSFEPPSGMEVANRCGSRSSAGRWGSRQTALPSCVGSFHRLGQPPVIYGSQPFLGRTSSRS